VEELGWIGTLIVKGQHGHGPEGSYAWVEVPDTIVPAATPKRPTISTIDEVTELIDAFAKEQGFIHPKFPVRQIDEYWRLFADSYLPRMMRAHDPDNQDERNFIKIFHAFVLAEGAGKSDIDDIRPGHRIVLLNYFDALTKGLFFTNAKAILEGRTIPSRGAVDFDGIASEVMTVMNAPNGARADGETCNKLVSTYAATGLDAAHRHMLALSMKPILYRTVSLDVIARSSFENWSKGELGLALFFLEEDRVATWRDSQEYRDFDKEYLVDGITVELAFAEAAAVDIDGLQCRLAMLYPRFPEDYEYTLDVQPMAATR
jgi:hypothetical protein